LIVARDEVFTDFARQGDPITFTDSLESPEKVWGFMTQIGFRGAS